MSMIGDIEWLTPSGAPAPLRGKGSVEDTVSHLDAVRSAVYGKALGLGREAAAALGQHHRTGAAHIEVGRHPNAGSSTPDWYVYLKDNDPGGAVFGVYKNQVDRSAMSIEFGWTQTHVFGNKLKKPIPHKGLHILRGVMRRAASRYRGAP